VKTTTTGLLLCAAALASCGGRGDGASAHRARSGQLADTIPPTVVSTSPEDGATGAAINGIVVATFSEAMDASSINGGTFTLAGPSGAVSGTVVYDAASLSARFVPSAPLAPNALYTTTVTVGVRDQAGNFLRAAVAWTFTTAHAEDAPPAVVATIPGAGALVAPNSSLIAVFSEAMNPATVSASTFTVAPASGGAPLAGTVQYDDASRSAILTAPLAGSTQYTATLTTGAQDLVGNALAAPAAWTFSTAAGPDDTQPSVVSASPSGANVPAGAPITVTFSEPVDPRTVTAAAFTLQGASGAVSGTVTYDPTSRTATFTPASALALGEAYTAAVTTGIRDLAGNALAAPAAWTFALAVRYSGFVSDIDFDRDEHVRTNVNAWWGFRSDNGIRLSWDVAQEGDHWRYAYDLYGADKAVNKWVNGFCVGTPDDFAETDLLGGWTLVAPVEGILTDVTADLVRPASAQSYTSASGLRSLFGIRWQMTSAHFLTDAPDTMFLLTFSTRRAPTWGDVVIESPIPAGGGLPTAWNWHLGDWTDAAVASGNNGGWVLVPGELGADTEAPYVRSVAPAEGSVGLGVHGSVSAAFSEAVDGAALAATGAFTLQDGAGAPVSGTVTYDPMAYVARFTPSAPLSYSTTYTASVAGVTDLAGHTMAPRAWTFTTEAPDTDLPRVLSTTPAARDTAVAVDRAVTAHFSEAIVTSNLDAAFALEGAGAAVSGAVTYDPATNEATFTPAAPLAYETTYTATIGGVRDLAGNAMLGSFAWSFTTAPPPPYVPTGDLNDDGIVDVLDARLALRIAAHEIAPTSEQLRAGDVAPLVEGAPAPDGKIDVGDALVILARIAGTESW
jgi:hypothetical protein